jgi:hypothetical protein
VFGDDFGCDGGHIRVIDHRGHRGHGVEEVRVKFVSGRF